MKIDRGHQTYIQNLNQNKNENQSKKDKDVKKPKDKAVNIEISKSARKLAKKIKPGEENEFSKKVEDIKKSILNDTYKVSSEDLADKIIENINLQDGVKNE